MGNVFIIKLVKVSWVVIVSGAQNHVIDLCQSLQLNSGTLGCV